MKFVTRFFLSYLFPWILILLITLSYHRDWALRAAPASDWLTVNKITVIDAVEGVSPEIIVDRQIKKDFSGRWTGSVKRITDDGTVAVLNCSSTGAANYEVQSVLPAKLNMDWWLFPRQCRPPPGRYVLVTTWQIELPGDLDKSVTAISNTFTIFKRE